MWVLFGWIVIVEKEKGKKFSWGYAQSATQCHVVMIRIATLTYDSQKSHASHPVGRDAVITRKNAFYLQKKV